MTKRGVKIMEVKELSVRSWSPGEEAENMPCTQVHLFMQIVNRPYPLVMRIKSREAIDSLIKALISHRDEVWPK